MKKYIYVSSCFVFLISITSYILFHDNEVIVYLVISNADVYKLPLEVSIDNEIIFNDTLINNPYQCKIIKKKLKIGNHQLSLRINNGEYYQESSFFVKYNQGLVISYFSPLYDEESLYSDSAYDTCQLGKLGKHYFDIQTRFTNFYLQ